MDILFNGVEAETSTPIEGIVSGDIPNWINGTLYRNGPGWFDLPKQTLNHWFDGMALVHRFRVVNGSVSYSNRFVKSDAYKGAIKHGRLVMSEFSTIAHPDPCRTLLDRFKTRFIDDRMTDNASVSVYPVGDCIYASGESGQIHRIDPVSLETEEKVDFNKLIAVNSGSAHPHLNNDGSIYTIGNSYRGGMQYNFIKMWSDEPGKSLNQAEKVGSLSIKSFRDLGYLHSFGMTENYFIVCENALRVNLLKVVTGKIFNVKISDSFVWRKKTPARFHIIERSTGKEIKSEFSYEAQSAFTVFHHINAYEDNGFLIIDVICHFENTYHKLTLKNLQHNSQNALDGIHSEVHRYVLPLDLKNAKEDENLINLTYTTAKAFKHNTLVTCVPDLKAEDLEMPQINYLSFNSFKYTYFYCISVSKETVYKVNMLTGEKLVFHEDGHYPSEPMFVAKPNAQDEDDGVLLLVLVSTKKERYTYLLVLDAKMMKEIGRVRFDVAIGRDLHGYYRPESNYKFK